VAGKEITIKNSDSAQRLQVWPGNGFSDTIDGGSANAVDSIKLAAGDERTYVADGSTNWVTKTNAAITTLAVANRGTGATSLTDGGVLLGSGTNASIGVGTGDTLTLAGLIFDDETLDIYDEGTFSPVLRPYSTEFDSVTYDALRAGRYVIIGHICHFEWTIRTDAITAGSGSGDMNVGGLPVAPGAATNQYNGFYVDSTSGFAGEFPVTYRVHSTNTLGALLYNADHTTAPSAVVIADIDTGANKNWCTCQGSYITA
jgi:hypothetical protein